MYTLKDNGIVEEVESGNNFGYVLEDSNSFKDTDYKVLQNQTSEIFVKCMKMLYNGRMELYYVTDDYWPMASMFVDIRPDTLRTIVVNLFANIIEVRNNGFLSCQNIDLSWDKIFVDSKTLEVKLVYIPINVKTFDSYAAFESELRASLIKLINKVLPIPNDKMEQFLLDLSNGSLSLEEIYKKTTGDWLTPPPEDPRKQKERIPETAIRLVAMNAPQRFEILIDKNEMLIGTKADAVDAVIPFNKMISRRHCKFIRHREGYCIMDVGSLNGTYINQKRIPPNQPFPIKRGDSVRLADSEFQIQ